MNTYEPPAIEELGTVASFTQDGIFGGGADGATYLWGTFEGTCGYKGWRCS